MRIPFHHMRERLCSRHLLYQTMAASMEDQVRLSPLMGWETMIRSKRIPQKNTSLQVEDNPFAFSSGQLSKLFNPKNLKAFRALGGPQGLVVGLRTDLSSGLSLDETALEGTVDLDGVDLPTSSIFSRKGYPFSAATVRSTASPSTHHISSGCYVDRKRIFGTNRLPEKKSKNLLQIMWMTFNDKVLIILTIVATISLILGLYQDFGQSERYGGPKVRWVEGVTIMVAVAIVVIVGSLNDYQKEQQFVKLNKKVKQFYKCLERQLIAMIERRSHRQSHSVRKVHTDFSL